MTAMLNRMKWQRALVLALAGIVISTSVQASGDTKLRSDVEREVGPIEAAYRAAPGDDNHRRAYADILFKLGNIWQANDVISPLVRSTSAKIDDLRLGANIALMMSDYDKAESLYERLREAADDGTEAHTAAIKGLVMVYYQTNQYFKSKTLTLPGGDDNRRKGTLLTFMQRFEGKPYQIEWATPDKVAHLPIVNDFTPAGALPEVKLEINGHTVEFILDTGGDRLYIDEAVAEKVGIRHIAKRQARYAYTKGEYVDEPLGVADTVKMGEVTLRNVPVIVAKWKVMGPTSDGVVTTQMLKQFLSTVDYENKRLTFRERSESGLRQLLGSLGEEKPHRLPFFMKGTHLMYAKGSLNGRQGLNMFVDSGLGASMPLVILDETVEFLGIEKTDIEGTEYYWSPIKSHGIGGLTRGATQALGNVFVEEDPYWRNGFIFDALISHQYLRHLGSWTIDFDTMTYYFPAGALDKDEPEPVSSPPAGGSKVKLENLDTYVGSYEVAPGIALEVTTAAGNLFLQAPGQQKVGMAAEADGTFSIALAGAKIVFEEDGSGAVTGLVLHQAGNQTTAKKKQP